MLLNFYALSSEVEKKKTEWSHEGFSKVSKTWFPIQAHNSMSHVVLIYDFGSI